MPSFDLYDHWRALDEEQRTLFAKVAKTSIAYLDIHIVHKRKTPKTGLLNRICKACTKTGATATRDEIVLWFYTDTPKRRTRAGRRRVAAVAAV